MKKLTNNETYEMNLNYFKIKSRQGNKAQCICPAHNDKQASLTVTKGEKCTLFYCHAGCSLENILSSAGISKAETFYCTAPKTEPWRTYVESREKRKIEAIYDYHSFVDGHYCFSKIRLEGKKILYGKLENSRFSYGLGHDTSRKSYKAIYGNMSKIQEAIKTNNPIFIPEGEKDVDTLEKMGYTAFTYGGCKDWQSEFADLVKNATVFILADNDKPGFEVANKIFTDIKPVCKSARIVIPTPNIPKGDISDYFINHTKNDFELLLKNVTENRMGEEEQKQREIKKIVNKLIQYDAVGNYSTTDKGSGSLFADIFKDKHRYNPDRREFMYYDGRRWIDDIEGMKAKASAKLLVDALFQYAAKNIPAEKEQGNYLKFVSQLMQLKNRTAMLNDSKDKYYFRNEDLDKDNYLLNVSNGVIVMKKNNIGFTEHNPNLLLSKMCNANYDPNAKCEQWEKFLDEIMLGDKEKIKYLQKIAGISLTGDTCEETLFILYGATTRNGKSTFAETLSYLLGNYSATIRPETLAVKQNTDSRQANGDIAGLKGVRFVNASEPPKRMVFDTALVKTLLGRDSIVARHIYERPFEFVPVFKLVINTNYLPQIFDDTIFGSGRINVISFDKHFEPSEQDKGLKDRLKSGEELSGILNWCLDGLKMYWSEGLKPPLSVKMATQEYRQQSDKIGNFINECLVRCEENSKAKDIYDTYVLWCENNGYGSENKGNFFAELRGRKMLSNTGTVNGKTCRNVVNGYVVCLNNDIEGNPFVD